MTQFTVSPDFTLALSAPPLPRAGEPGAMDATTAAPGTPAGQPAARAPGLLDGQFLWIMLLMFGGIIAFSIFGQRRERKKRESMISAIAKHDKVQTIGGVIGSVVEVKPQEIVLKVDESSNTRITFSRSAVQQIIRQGARSGGKDGAEASS